MGTTSTLTRRIGKVRRRFGEIRAVLVKPDSTVSIDQGTSLTKIVALNRQAGRPGLEGLSCIQGRVQGSHILPGRRSRQKVAAGIGGHGVRTSFHQLPDMPTKDLDKVIRRTVRRESGGDSAVAWEAHRAEPGQTEVLVASAPMGTVVQSFEELEGEGINVSHVFAEALALRECLRLASPDTETTTTAIANIGTRWTQIVLLEHGKVTFSRSVELGTIDMVSGVSRNCDIPETEAADLILDKGIDISYLPEDLEERAPVEVLREVTEQLAREILRSLAYVSRDKKRPLPETMLICGGGALIPNIAQTLEMETGIEARILDPLDHLVGDAPADLADLGPLFCVAVGLALLAGRAETMNLLPRQLRTRKTRRTRAAGALVGALASLVVILLTAFFLDSSTARYDQLIAVRSAAAASLLETLGPDDEADPEFLKEKERSYAYSLVVKPQPGWVEVLREFSNLVPAGVLLDEMLLVREMSESGEHDVWRLSGEGAVIDPDLPPTILTRMESEMEGSPVFRDVRVTPLGSTTLSIDGRRVDSAILFDMGSYLE